MEENKLPSIYSSKVVLGFSILFSALFGGVLMFINLREIGKKKEANIVLGISILLLILTYWITSIPAEPKSSLTYLCGIVSGCILTYFFFPKYIPNEIAYPKKPIWKPLIAGIGIIVIVILSFVFAYQYG
jgi:uncharacterized membrane protein YcfT